MPLESIPNAFLLHFPLRWDEESLALALHMIMDFSLHCKL